MLRTGSSSSEIARSVRGEEGFTTALRLAPSELARIRVLVDEQWLGVIANRAPELVAEFRGRGIGRYHELADQLPHAEMWPKAARILPAEAATEVRAMAFMSDLDEAFGPFTVSDEDEVGWQEIYWRLVRPGQPGDMGPLHADRWFWDLGHGTTPPDVERVKVWVALVTEPGRSGLRVVPGSHRRAWRFHGEPRHGMLKPQIDEDEATLDARVIETEPGDAIVFHDGLLHGGAPNRGTLTRVSFEFTMFVPAARS
jgi:hypothetical protein